MGSVALGRNPAALGNAVGPRTAPSPMRFFSRRSRGQRLPTSKQELGDVETEGKAQRNPSKGLEDSLEINGMGVRTAVPAAKVPVRLWSRLGTDMKHEEGSVFGAAALVAGTTVGAGILALPAVTEDAGFVASSITIGIVCAFSIATGLLIAEVNLNTLCELGSGGVSLVSMAERTMGKTGTRIASSAYIFLHYALLVAYISKGGGVVANLLHAPEWVGALAFNLTLGGFCYSAKPRVLDRVNGLLVVAVVTSFLWLLLVASGGIHSDGLLQSNWSSVPDALPVIALSFVYHNIVPVICTNLEGDRGKVRLAIIGGSLVPLTMFISWNAAILGSITPGLSDVTQDPLEILKATSTAVGPLVESFSFLAIATSYIGFVLGLSDFLSDALRLPSGRRNFVPYALTLVPPFLFALTFKDVFFNALDVAGTYGVLILFGIMPAIMAWQERYEGKAISSIRVVPGGKPMLLVVGGSAALIVLREMFEGLSGVL